MIRELFLENFLFIRKSHLEFSAGLNVITGETGAGKSVLLEALKLLLGKKARPGLVLPGTAEAKIQGIFDISDSPQVNFILQDIGMANEENPTELTITRTFKSEGTGKIFINGILANLNNLKNVGTFLMEIHGQNEHQTLLDPKIQLKMLDRYGGESHLKYISEMQSLFRHRQKLLSELEDLQSKFAEREARLEELKEIQELLANLNLSSPNEEQEIREELRRLEFNEQIVTAVSAAKKYFEGDGEFDGILVLLKKARDVIGQVVDYDSTLQSLYERLETAYVEAEDMRSELSRKTEFEDFDPKKLEYLQVRLAEIAKVCRKLKTDSVELLELKQKVDEEIAFLTCPDTSIEKKQNEFAEADCQWQKACEKVSSERRKIASKLEKATISEMKHLGFNSSGFTVAFSRCEPGIDGTETIEFMVNLNPGAPGGPLRKIASGGELSRVALALKTVIAKGDEMPSLVFDEIDSGIGGETAIAVAESLSKLGKTKQIIVVTHLHQIAREGMKHFTVEKRVNGNSTLIKIEEVEGEEREQEIARMLGTRSDEGLAFARSILTNHD